MGTISKTKHPFFATANFGTSGSGAGTFTHTITTVPAGQALVILQLRFNGTLVPIRMLGSGGTQSYYLDGPPPNPVNFVEPIITNGLVQFEFSLSGAYSYNIVGYYVSINT